VATQNSINSPIPFAASKGGTGLVSPTAHGIMVGEGASPMNPIVLTDGQVLVGVTGADPTPRTLTAGTGIDVDLTTPGQVIFSNTAGAATFPWTEVTGTSVALTVNRGFIMNNAALVTGTLPATAAVGDVIEIVGEGAGGWLIAQNASQEIRFGDVVTTNGVGGSLASTNAGDCISLVCITANTTFRVKNSVGNITYV
jgi:hypothetical protein